MEFNVTMQQWIDRFVMRMSQLRAGAVPDDLIAQATALWPSTGQREPEAVADSRHAELLARSAPDPFEQTLGSGGRADFERTERIPVERIQAAGGYVRDDAEWIARCVARVLQLDPLIKADEARRSVGDLAGLERWRLLNPEQAAEQLYTPIRPRTE